MQIVAGRIATLLEELEELKHLQRLTFHNLSNCQLGCETVESGIATQKWKKGTRESFKSWLEIVFIADDSHDRNSLYFTPSIIHSDTIEAKNKPLRAVNDWPRYEHLTSIHIVIKGLSK